MAVKLGYGGLANTNGVRDFTGKEEAGAEDESAFRFRSNDTLNRRRYGALWFSLLLFWLMR